MFPTYLLVMLTPGSCVREEHAIGTWPFRLRVRGVESEGLPRCCAVIEPACCLCRAESLFSIRQNGVGRGLSLAFVYRWLHSSLRLPDFYQRWSFRRSLLEVKINARDISWPQITFGTLSLALLPGGAVAWQPA